MARMRHLHPTVGTPRNRISIKTVPNRRPPEDMFSPELSRGRRQFWDAVKSRRHPRGETSNPDTFQADDLTWGIDISRCLEASSNVKSAEAVFGNVTTQSLEEDFLADFG
eukprot:Protomagalhaensia_sp_Gyna_25__130@NODE_1062_length_2233_cov_6_424339_g846_i0_p4_GENE_NODE_1062_length_2233_cov_6_424339_g846_i0NODE_1062_length_2233_cov_6_424339_g846_i0_p4_ORF_typecomplete_len110_score14_53_NODE_1062_length_2233_cov_6_424339_g846_i0317646